MPSKFLKLIFIYIIAIASSCSLYDGYQAEQPANIMELESRLVTAGFNRVPIETPEQNDAVASLPLHRLNRYQSAAGSVYWYADPTICSCLYEGDQKAYDSYAGLLQQEHDTAEYINDVQPEQVAGLSPFGYAFPSPILFGGWPVIVHHDGFFHSPGGGSSSGGHGGGGSGVTSKSSGNGGGAIHSHSHSGGGHSFGHAGGHGGGHR
jgi:hypothetical protein